MFKNTRAFSSFSVDDMAKARSFYGETLGLEIKAENDLTLDLFVRGERHTGIYLKTDHAPATFTVLNFMVDDLDAAVDELTARGVRFERYQQFDTDDKGIHRQENVAWFKDPAGNILSVVKSPETPGG